MPIIKSAIKRAKQNKVRATRLQPFRSQLKSAIKKYTDFVKDGKKDEATKMLPMAFKAIDTATKKHILHRNTAARRKSMLAKMLK